MILQKAPLGVNPVHHLHQGPMLEAFVIEKLLHVRPVLLLDVRIVILSIGSAAGEFHRALRTAQIIP